MKFSENSTVFIGSSPNLIDETIVFTNHESASPEAVRHLLNIGYEKIGMVVSEKPKIENEDKIEGYKKELALEKVEYDETYIQKGENTMEGGYLAASKLMNICHKKKISLKWE